MSGGGGFALFVAIDIDIHSNFHILSDQFARDVISHGVKVLIHAAQ